MQHDDDQFTPETVDEQIEQLAHLLIQRQQPAQKKIRLVKTLQQIYQTRTSSSLADRASLERIKQRINHERHVLETRDTPLENIEPFSARHKKYKRTHASSNTTKAVTFARTFATIIAATLLLTLLIGSWAVVVSREARQKMSQETRITLSDNPVPATYALSYSTLYKLNPQNGTIIWKQKLTIEAYAQMVYAHGILYISSLKNEMEALNAQNGAVLWHVPGDTTPTTGLPQLSVANNLVYGIREKHIVAFDARNGTQHWILQTLNLQIQEYFEVENDTIYTANLGNLYAINALTGQVRWHHLLNSGYFLSVQQANGIVYASYGNVLYAMKENDGNLLWHQTITSTQEFAALDLVDGIIYAASNDHAGSINGSYVYAFSTQDGTRRWTSPAGYQFTTSSPVNAGIVLTNRLFANNGNSPAGLDARTGKLVWQGCSGNCSMNVSTVANGIVYSDKSSANAHQSQLLVALDLKTGKQLAQYSEPSSSAIEVAHTILYSLERSGDATSKPVPDVIRAISTTSGKVLWHHTLNNNDTNGSNSYQLIAVS